MSAVNVTPDTQNAAITSAASFLLSLNAGLGGDNAQGKLFTKFLLESQSGQNPVVTAQKPLPQQSQAPAHSISQTIENKGQDVTEPSLPVLKNLVSAWRHLVNRMQDHGNNKTATTELHPSRKNNDVNTPAAADGTSGNSTADAATVAAAATTGAPADPATTVSADNQDTSQTDTTGTAAASAGSTPVATQDNDGDSDNGNDDTTISDILKELQVLALLIEKQLQNLQTQTGTAQAGSTAPVSDAATAPASVPAQAADPAQALIDPSQVFGASAAADPSALLPVPATPVTPADSTQNTDPSVADQAPQDAGTPTLAQALTDLLKLVQLAAKQLEGTTDTTSAAGNSITGDTTHTTDPATVSVWPTDTQLKADLKVLLDTLRASVAANKGQGTGYGFGLQKADLNSGTTPTDTTVANLPPAAPDASRDAWMQQDDLLGFFKPVAAHAAVQSAVSAAATAQNQSMTDNNNFTAAVSTATNATAAADNKGDAPLDPDLNSHDNTNAGAKMPLVNTPDNANLAASAGSSSSAITPYSFASQLSEARAANGGLAGLPDAVEQVILKLNRSVKNGDDQMTLQLNPADLGRVNIKLNFSTDGKVQGTVVADNPATLHLLLKDVRGLERALQEAGLRADPGSLQFSLGDPSGQQSRQAAQDFASSAPSYNGGDKSMPEAVNDLSAITADTTETYYVTPNRVNLRV